MPKNRTHHSSAPTTTTGVEYDKPNSVFKSNSVIQVLCIEDSPTQASIIQAMLESTPDVTFQLRCVDCVAAGIQQLQQSAFDVVLLDLNLPDSTGLDSFLRVYARHPEIPIVILTAIGQRIVGEALRKGAQDYLVKGDFDRDKLVRSMQYAIERNRRQQAERSVLQTQLEERRRLARDLHDGVIQSLTAIRLNLQILESELSSGGDMQSAAALQEIADEAYTAIHDVRLLSYDLHPSELDRREFAEAIELYGKAFGQRNQLAVEVINESTVSCGDYIKHHLYRIVQECMRNVAKHAKATKSGIRIRNEDFFIVVEVVDDGIGFDVFDEASNVGLGMISIRERARMLGGTATIQSQPGSGTHVLIEIPF